MAKAQLVAQAEKLTALDDLERAVDRAKRLQNQWKTIGGVVIIATIGCYGRPSAVVVMRCSKKNPPLIRALKQQLQAHCDQAKALIDELSALIALSGDAFLASGCAIPAFATKF